MHTTKYLFFLFVSISFILSEKLAFGKKHVSSHEAESQTRPNIIYFLIDDWGYNDVGYYGNTDSQTPFIDKLVKEESLRLDRYYVLPECTATRCALLTGRYPMRYGMQDGILYYQSTYALSNREFLLSNEFQNQGYKTHIVGKWHLGMMSLDYTPTYRGFDSFLGFYAGLIHYYSHLGIEDSYPNKIDFHDGTDSWHEENTYTMYTYTDRILNILDEASDSQSESIKNNEEIDPFFLYVGWQGSHYPSEAPESYANIYSSQSENERKYFQAQTTLTDELLEKMVGYLKSLNLWDNTLLVVASDNGADWGYGDNSPLRGAKFTLWEGGVRVPAFITGGYLPEARRGGAVSDVPIHVTDWYPTLLSAANIVDPMTPNELDGIDFWDIFKYEDTPRTDEILNERYILLNADSYGCGTDACGAILYGGRWKLVTGTNQLVSFETGSAEVDTCFWHRDFAVNEEEDNLGCNYVPDTVTTDSCVCSQTLCLFDLENDPCEYYNVFDENEELGQKLYEKLEELYNEQTIVLFEKTFNVATSIAAKGSQSGFWEPWCDTINDFDGWESLKFEGLLEGYYTGSDSDDNDASNEMDIVWIAIIVAACGVAVCGLFVVARYWCIWKRSKKLRARMTALTGDENEEDAMGRTDLQPENGRGRGRGIGRGRARENGKDRGTFERSNPVFVGSDRNINENINDSGSGIGIERNGSDEANENDETMPLAQNEVRNSYLMAQTYGSGIILA